jgi:hypothetical protein
VAQLRLVRPMARVDTPLPRKLMRAFRRSVEAHFTPVAVSFGSRLLRLSPSLYGFLTRYAVVTIGVYHGHFPAVVVKLRQRQPSDTLGVADGRDIGLGNIVAFLDPSVPRDERPDEYWTDETLDAEARRHADDLLRYGRPFVTEPDADWKGLRSFVDQQIKKALDEAPCLRKYQKA